MKKNLIKKRFGYFKRAEMGIGTLILFIALLLTAAVAASVLIETIGATQENSLSVGDQARDQVATGLKIVDVSAKDGSAGEVDLFEIIMKLKPGSSPIKLSTLLFSMGTENTTSVLRYRGENGEITEGNTGYNTFISEEKGEMGNYYDQVDEIVNDLPVTNLEIDLDLDGVLDTVVVCRDGRAFCHNTHGNNYVQFNLSTAGEIYVPLLDESGALLDSTLVGETFGNYLTPIGAYGYMTITGQSSGSWRIPSGNMHVYLPPTTLNVDLDDDSSDDSIVINDTHVIVHYSSKGNITKQFNDTKGIAYSLGVNLSDGGQAIDKEIILTDNESSTIFGRINISGTTTRASYIDDAVTFLVQPEKLYQGYFVLEPVQTSANYQPGVLNLGDVGRVYLKAPRGIQEDEQITIRVIPKKGSTSVADFFMPNVISSKTVHLYP